MWAIKKWCDTIDKEHMKQNFGKECYVTCMRARQCTDVAHAHSAQGQEAGACLCARLCLKLPLFATRSSCWPRGHRAQCGDCTPCTCQVNQDGCVTSSASDGQCAGSLPSMPMLFAQADQYAQRIWNCLASCMHLKLSLLTQNKMLGTDIFMWMEF